MINSFFWNNMKCEIFKSSIVRQHEKRARRLGRPTLFIRETSSLENHQICTLLRTLYAYTRAQGQGFPISGSCFHQVCIKNHRNAISSAGQTASCARPIRPPVLR